VESVVEFLKHLGSENDLADKDNYLKGRNYCGRNYCGI